MENRKRNVQIIYQENHSPCTRKTVQEKTVQSLYLGSIPPNLKSLSCNRNLFILQPFLMLNP